MAETRLAGTRIAVLLPCYNEEAAIAQTVAAFRAALPDAPISTCTKVIGSMPMNEPIR